MTTEPTAVIPPPPLMRLTDSAALLANAAEILRDGGDVLDVAAAIRATAQHIVAARDALAIESARPIPAAVAAAMGGLVERSYFELIDELGKATEAVLMDHRDGHPLRLAKVAAAALLALAAVTA